MSIGTGSEFNAAINIVKLSIGCGILALPFSTFACGLLMSPIVNLYVAVVNYFACVLVLRSRKASEHIPTPRKVLSTYSKIAFAGCGWIGVGVVEFSILATLLGVCISYQITFAELIADIPDNTFPSYVLSIICGILVYPLTIGKNVDSLAVVSLAGIGCLLLSVVVIIGFGVVMYGNDASMNGIDFQVIYLWPTSIASFTSYIGVSTFCYGQASLIFPIEESMIHRNGIFNALKYGILFVWLTYVFVGDGIAYLYAFSPSGKYPAVK